MIEVLYLYAVLATAPRALRLRGLAREPVRFVRSGRLVAAVGEMERAPAPAITTLRAHDRVVRRLAAAARATLPARFGSVADSPAALRAALRGRARVLGRALDRVAGREQMTLHVRLGAPGPIAGGPGTRHLRRLAARDPLAHAEVREVLDALGPIVRAQQVDAAPDDRSPARIHHLVDRAHVDRYRTAVRRAARAHPALAARATGPWAPYAFGPEA